MQILCEMLWVCCTVWPPGCKPDERRMRMHDTELRDAAERWMAEDPDPRARDGLEEILRAKKWGELRERFGARLEFGTAGLRGVLGAGPNRMNRLVVIRTTAGLARYLLDTLPDVKERGVVV